MVVVVMIALIAVAVTAMLHGYVIALHEAFAIFVALIARYRWMAEHTRTVRVHSTVILHVEASCLDAVMEALPSGVMELGRRGVPLL